MHKEIVIAGMIMDDIIMKKEKIVLKDRMNTIGTGISEIITTVDIIIEKAKGIITGTIHMNMSVNMHTIITANTVIIRYTELLR
jgi:hypothetical protein